VFKTLWSLLEEGLIIELEPDTLSDIERCSTEPARAGEGPILMGVLKYGVTTEIESEL